MLYFTRDDVTIATWYVGEENPCVWEIVDTVQADGDELEYLRRTFENLPFSNRSRVQTWRGDFAQFIADNL